MQATGYNGVRMVDKTKFGKVAKFKISRTPELSYMLVWKNMSVGDIFCFFADYGSKARQDLLNH